MSGLIEVLPLLPLSIVTLLTRLGDHMPGRVKPLGGSAAIQVLVGTVYTSISCLVANARLAKVESEKIDFLIAVSENICR